MAKELCSFLKAISVINENSFKSFKNHFGEDIIIYLPIRRKDRYIY